MDDPYISSIESIDCVDDLRAQLRDTTVRLQSAARMGIDLATQNQALTAKLSELSREQEDLRQRLDLVERDRRWMQDQSLRVDQVRASLNDLLAKTDSNRSRYAATESRIDGLAVEVTRLRDKVDEQTHALDSVAPMRKWAGELSAIQRALADAQNAISGQGLRLSELDESVTKCESRRRTHATETLRALSDLSGRANSSEVLQRETQAQMDWAASHQRELQESLQSVIREYNTMLNEHEQAIRILGDSHAVLESQVALSHAYESGTGSATIHTPLSARNKGTGLPTPVSSVKPRAAASPMESHYPGSVSSASNGAIAQRGRDSGTYTVPSMRGESLGDIFANDSLDIAEKAVSLPSVVSHKAASVAGGALSTRARPRQRNSSFSRIRPVPTSPTRMGPAAAVVAGGLGGILSASAHVGVGWSNYWEARRHRLQFDIQKRLSLSAATLSIADQRGDNNDLSIED